MDLKSTAFAPARIQLPAAPSSETGAVKAWSEPMEIRTWMPAPPDTNPLFLEKRVYQGSSGRIYPLPVIDRIETEPELKAWQAIHLENEYLQFMILPELGGRIHVGLDKINGYDFFYRQNVIKPALVGLAGPWISGGVEFNWPQHHRPATFMPVEWTIERHPDGAVTVWCSDHDPMVRMKGMHGLCLRPGQARLELRVRLYNRTTDTQTFLWWANVATHVHEKYQSFFPTDVRFVADHAKRAVTQFPFSQGTYYGVDYGKRARQMVPTEQMPSQFVPDISYPANDLSRYANIPVPTSYMIAASNGDFIGGYDHGLNAGVVHVANHHIAPGKKQWTWGNHDFGYAWDRCLTESDGPYIELMAGVYTDNQPDFSFLAPGETKAFSQFWYPIREIGVPDFANLSTAVRVESNGAKSTIHLMVTEALSEAILKVHINGEQVAVWNGGLVPDVALHYHFTHPSGKLEFALQQNGQTLMRYPPSENDVKSTPEIATEPPLAQDVQSNDELYLIGIHLEQYRHATRSPEPYWREAICRDAGDSRANAALGRWHLRRGEFTLAESHLRAAIRRLTERNPNPSDGEPHYNLGLTLAYLGRVEESYAAFYKATWNAAWRGPAYQRLAEIDCARQSWKEALDHVNRSLRADADNLNARNLLCVLLRKLGRDREAEDVLREIIQLDPLDSFCRYLSSGQPPRDGQQKLDLIFDLMRAGLLHEALSVAESPAEPAPNGAATMIRYVRAELMTRRGGSNAGSNAWKFAATGDPAYVFPSRLEELLLLEGAIRQNPDDAHAHFYLGNLLYDRRRHLQAIAHWERSVGLNPQLATAWRNLGFGYYNVAHQAARSLAAFDRAHTLAPNDARIFFEYDQLKKRVGETSDRRLADLEAHRSLVERRDDLSLEWVTLSNNLDMPETALALLRSRQFQPWEGGEGLVLAQYVRANILLGQKALRAKDPAGALAAFQAAGQIPPTLGEAKHLLMNLSIVDYWLGLAHQLLGFDAEAQKCWLQAASRTDDFQQMQQQQFSDMTYWSALALRRLNRETEAQSLFKRLLEYARALAGQTAQIDYFATSLPAVLLFDDDLQQRQLVQARFLEAQACLGLGHKSESETLLRQVLQINVSYTGAIDLLREMSA